MQHAPLQRRVRLLGFPSSSLPRRVPSFRQRRGCELRPTSPPLRRTAPQGVLCFATQTFARHTTIADIRVFAHAQLPPATLSNRGDEPPEFNMIVRA